MKPRFQALFSVAFFLIVLCSPLHAQKIWQRDFSDYSFGSRSVFWDVAIHKNGRLCIAATTEETYNERALTLYDVDKNPGLTWSIQDTGSVSTMAEHNIIVAADTLSGNTIVTGFYLTHGNPGLETKPKLTCYKSDGQILWDIPVPVNYATPKALRIDAFGYIYLGVTVPFNGYSESHILKFSPDGNLLWSKFYADFTKTEHYEIQDILLDKGDSDLAIGVIKSYNRLFAFRFSQTNGSLTWISQAMGVSDNKLIYGSGLSFINGSFVLGYSATAQTSPEYDFVLSRFSGGNNLLWEATFDGGYGWSDFLTKISVSNNKIVATGQGYASGHTDIITAAFNLSNGAELWSKRKDGNGYNDATTDMITDQNGNIYISGFYETSSWYHDGVIIKYDPQGNELLTIKSAGTTEAEDEFRRLALDPSSQSIYSIGMRRRFERPEMPFYAFHVDISVKKWDMISGAALNQLYKGGRGKGLFSGRWVKADNLGNVYFAGYRNLGFTKFNHGGYIDLFDFVLLKYNASGDLQWYNILDEDTHDEIWPPELGLIDQDQSPVFLINKQNTNTVLVRYTADGLLDWEKSITAQGSSFAQAENLIVSDQNNYFIALRDHPYMKIMKINAEGEILWSKNLDSLSTDCNDFSIANMCIAPNEEVFVSFRNKACWSDDKIWKLDANGEVLWTSSLIGGGNSKEILIKDALYVLTESKVSKYNPSDGTELWSIDLEFGETGKKLHYFQDKIVVFTSNALIHVNSSGEKTHYKPIEIPGFLLLQNDHFIIPGWIYEASFFNYFGDKLSEISCPECATYNSLYPQTQSNTWGNGLRTVGLDAKDGHIYWGGTREEPLHSSIHLFDAFGANVLHLIKYRYDETLNTDNGSTTENNGNTVSIYPNPNNGDFSIQFNGWHSQPTNVKITDITGKSINFSTEIVEDGIKVKGIFQTGLYFVDIWNSNQMESAKILVSKQL